jgi:hypothetical protein
LLRLVKLVAGQEIEEVRLHPEEDEARLAACAEKREYRRLHLEAIRAADRQRKARWRDRRRTERQIRKARAGRTGTIYRRALGEKQPA